MQKGNFLLWVPLYHAKKQEKRRKIRWVIHNLTAVSKIEALNSRLHKQTRKVLLFTRRSRYPEEFKAVCEWAAAALRLDGSLTCFSHCVSILCENTSNCCKKRRMARCTVWTAPISGILYKMYKFDMKRQNAASPDRIKRPGPVALTKPERMLCAQSKPVNEPPFGTVFCCIQRISASRYEGLARPPRRRSSIVLWRTHWEIIDIKPAYCMVMIYFNKICRLTPALLIFHEIFRNTLVKILMWKIGRFSRNVGDGRAGICHQGEKSANVFSE